MTQIAIRPAQRGPDEARVWHILRPAVEAGETFCADPSGGQDGGLAYFWPDGAQVWIASVGDRALGSYYLRANQGGGGAHICNAGFCTHPDAAGRGVASAMLDHALDTARAAGFRAMQFNFVVSTNTRAIALWERAGFGIIGRIPEAFHHPTAGYVDALVMHRSLV